MQRNKYSKEFKLGAISQVLQKCKTISKVSKDLGIISTMLSRWIYEYKNNGDSAFSGNEVKIKNKDFEIESLKKKIKN